MSLLPRGLLNVFLNVEFALSLSESEMRCSLRRRMPVAESFLGTLYRSSQEGLSALLISFPQRSGHPSDLLFPQGASPVSDARKSPLPDLAVVAGRPGSGISKAHQASPQAPNPKVTCRTWCSPAAGHRCDNLVIVNSNNGLIARPSPRLEGEMAQSSIFVPISPFVLVGAV